MAGRKKRRGRPPQTPIETRIKAATKEAKKIVAADNKLHKRKEALGSELSSLADAVKNRSEAAVKLAEMVNAANDGADSWEWETVLGVLEGK